MTTIDSRNPRAATCEDWEEDEEKDLSLSEADPNSNANAARKRSQSRTSDTKSTLDHMSHNGSDSGYSSKAGTSEYISTGRKKAADLRIDTEVVMERERQPYTQKPTRPVLTHQPSKKKDGTSQKIPKQNKQQPQEIRFRHVQGQCVTCDTYGYHIEPAPLLPVSIPHSPKTTKTTTRTRDDSATQARPRRTSSKHDGRPVSVLVVPHPQQPVYAPEYAHPISHAHPYNYQIPSPITPSTNIVPYSPYPQQYIPDTPMSSSYSTAPTGYLDAYMASQEAYHHQAPTAEYYATAEPVQPYYIQYPIQEPIQRRPSQNTGARPFIKSNRTIEDDRRAMPPPARPGLKKSTTEKVSKRQSVHYEGEERPGVTSKRSSRDCSHPPTVFRATSGDIQTRPRPSKSYSTGSEPLIVSSTSRPRHNTDPSRYQDHFEQKTADAESYIAKTSKAPAQELTTETLKKISSRPLASDAGTHKSKESSRSKISTSGKTTIVMNNGVSVSLPQDIQESLSLQLGNVTLSVSGQDQSKGGQRQIEPRSPGDSGRSNSRRSTTSGSADGQSLKRESTRKSSQPEPTTHSANSSRKSSRPPSSTLANLEFDRSRQQPDDFDNPEAFYGA